MSRRKVLIGVSIAGHAALFAGVFVHSVWNLEQLGREPRPRMSLAAIVPPAAEGGPISLPEQKLERKQPKEPPRVVKEPRQPRPPREEPKLEAATGPTSLGGADGPGTGGPDGPPGGDPCAEPDGCPPEVAPLTPPVVRRPPPAPAPPVQTVAPQVLKGLRTRGETAIYPPGDVLQQMHRSGDLKTSASIKVCIGADGAVATIGLLRSTRYAAYDEALLAGARRWVYRPYTVNGRPVPVCSVVTFQYEMK